jgi:hypothetical protein
MYVFIYCKWAQVRWQNYIDINNIQMFFSFRFVGLKVLQQETLPYTETYIEGM